MITSLHSRLCFLPCHYAYVQSDNGAHATTRMCSLTMALGARILMLVMVLKVVVIKVAVVRELGVGQVPVASLGDLRETLFTSKTSPTLVL